MKFKLWITFRRMKNYLNIKRRTPINGTALVTLNQILKANQCESMTRNHRFDYFTFENLWLDRMSLKLTPNLSLKSWIRSYRSNPLNLHEVLRIEDAEHVIDKEWRRETTPRTINTNHSGNSARIKKLKLVQVEFNFCHLFKK